MNEETKKLIQTLECIKVLFEWEYPLDYVIAIDDAIVNIKQLQEVKKYVNTLRNFNQHNEYIEKIKEILQ